MVRFWLKKIYLSTVYHCTQYPKCWIRLILHIIPIYRPSWKLRFSNANEYFGDLFAYTVDVLLIGYLYDIINPLFMPKQRYLDEDEVIIAKNVFSSHVRYRFVTLHYGMSERIRELALAYVSLNTINYRKEIYESVFIHEMVHVWQYQKYGVVYIFRALKAQYEETNCYNYGGVDTLYRDMLAGKHIEEYNFEAQAQIIQDAYERGVFQSESSTDMAQSVYRYYHGQLDRSYKA